MTLAISTRNFYLKTNSQCRLSSTRKMQKYSQKNGELSTKIPSQCFQCLRWKWIFFSMVFFCVVSSLCLTTVETIVIVSGTAFSSNGRTNLPSIISFLSIALHHDDTVSLSHSIMSFDNVIFQIFLTLNIDNKTSDITVSPSRKMHANASSDWCTVWNRFLYLEMRLPNIHFGLRNVCRTSK